jgi:hypothetical protein
MYDDVPSGQKLLAMQSQNLTDAPADAVAQHRAAERPFYAAAESRRRAIFRVRQQENDKVPPRLPAAAAVNSFEFGAAQQAAFAGKSKTPCVSPARFRRA